MRKAVWALAATEYVTVAFPAPDTALVRVIQEALLLAVQAAPADGARSTKLPAPPPALTVAEAALSENKLADCVTIRGIPAMVKTAWRAVAAVFAVSENDTLPLPAPDAPAVMLSQDTLLEAIQVQPGVAVNETK